MAVQPDDGISNGLRTTRNLKSPAKSDDRFVWIAAITVNSSRYRDRRPFSSSQKTKPTHPPTPTPKTPSGLTQSDRDTALVEYALNPHQRSPNRRRSSTRVTLDDQHCRAIPRRRYARSHCTRGHWGPDGMKPYMRYTLAGGEQYSAENVFAIDLCPNDPDTYIAESTVAQIDYADGPFSEQPGPSPKHSRSAPPQRRHRHILPATHHLVCPTLRRRLHRIRD